MGQVLEKAYLALKEPIDGCVLTDKIPRLNLHVVSLIGEKDPILAKQPQKQTLQLRVAEADRGW